MPNTYHTSHSFRGFDDYVELFRSGVQTDSQGRTKTWTNDELDEIVANHEPAPIVIGHPKTDSPSYGWSHELKREGDFLLGKFSDVEPEFEKMVEDKRFPNRSVRFKATDKGLALQHVGWLGAAAPAVKGLKQVEFNSDDTDAYEFVSDAWATGVITRTFRRLRDFLIEKFSAEEADRVVNDFDLEMLADLAAEQRRPVIENTNSFNAPDGDKPVPKTYTDEQIEQIRKDARDAVTAEFSTKETDYKTQLSQEREKRLRAEFQAYANDQVDEGKMSPAMATGIVEFMLALSAQPVEFEFSTGEGESKKDVKQSPADWFKGFVATLPKGFDFSETRAGEHLDDNSQFEYNAPQGATVNPERLALHKKAVEYMNANNVDYVEAVIAVESK